MTSDLAARTAELEAEVSRLRKALAEAERANEDLEMALTTTVEHGDMIEEQLATANDQLQSEIAERNRAERRLNALMEVLRQQKDDLEILVGTLVEHADSVDAQMWDQLLESEARGQTDPLTGLANRRRLEGHLAAHWTAALRDGRPLALLMCDVDHFKAFNDTYGHPAGDSCLRAVAGVLAQVANRPTDLATRYGGEEFAVVLPETQLDGALRVAQRLIDGVRNLGIAHAGSLAAPVVTLSIGVGVAVPSPNRDVAELIAQADHRLYRAKQLGRDQVCGED